MAEYREIQGAAVQSLASSTGTIEGQIWYDNVNGNFKLESLSTVGAWATGGTLNTARIVSDAFGTQTAAVYTTGQLPPNSYTTATEEYNGTVWTTAIAYPTPKTAGGTAGTLTAGLVAGGYEISTANEYDGTSWAGTGSLPTAADNIGSCGTDTQTNVIMTIGRTPASGNAGTTTSVTYNGSVFAGGPATNTARMFGMVSGGTGTAGLIYGGFIDPSPPAMTNAEEYDGSAWSTTNPLNRASGLNTGFGTQTNAIAQVNTPGHQGAEQYDGTCWTNVADMTQADNSANYSAAAGSTGSTGFISSRGPGRNSTEEWTGAGVAVTQTLTTT
tara:strand:+ start:28 stop:1014 length:987 start_codon:yes stop_codon:yes gene_type:complete